MAEKLMDKSCGDFTAVLASRAPVPGGGGAAALVGALGTALCSMAGNLTLGKKKYAAVEPDIRRLRADGETVRRRLLELADMDAAAFEPLSRAEVLEAATLAACCPPMEMLEQTCRAVELLEEMLEKGSVMMVSDVGCGASCCRAALESAGLNVFINTRTLTDRNTARRLEEHADRLLADYLPRAERITKEVTRRLRTPRE